MNLALIATLLAQMNQRCDAGETAAFSRQLEYVKTKTYDVQYAGLKAREFIPVDNSVPSGAESFVWRQWDMFGMADIIANYADDLPRSDVLAKENVQGIKSLGTSYAYSIQDVRASAMAGMQLDVKRSSNARRSIELKIDQLASVGDSTAGLPGFLNHANVPVIQATGVWSGLTAAQILADLHRLANTIVNSTKQTHTPDTLLLPTVQFQQIATMSISSDETKTVLKAFLATTTSIKNVDQWHRLDLADAQGDGPRAVAYQRTEDVVSMVIPQEFEQFPPQAKNLAFNVPCHARFGGVSVHYPLAMVYLDAL